MFVFGNLLSTLAHILDIILNIIMWLIIIRALISWVNPDPYNHVVRFLYKTTEPILYPVRKFLPLDFHFGIDISPLIVLLCIYFARSFVVRTLLDLSIRLR